MCYFSLAIFNTGTLLLKLILVGFVGSGTARPVVGVVGVGGGG